MFLPTETNICPPSRPYAYRDGDHCCKTKEEKTPVTTCDGLDFNISSTCCQNADNEACPVDSGCLDNIPSGPGSGCCLKIHLAFPDGASSQIHNSLSGVYNMENKIVHGKPIWKSEDGSYAIWFTKMNLSILKKAEWIVGNYTDIGEEKGYIKTFGHDCIETLDYPWSLMDGTELGDGNSVSVDCLTKNGRYTIVHNLEKTTFYVHCKCYVIPYSLS